MIGTKTATQLRKERMETPLLKFLEMFLADKRTEGKSAKTVIWYEQKLSHFATFLGNDPPVKLPDFTLESAKAFVLALQSKTCRFENHPFSPVRQGGLSTFTIHGYVRSMKVFSVWLRDEGFTPVDVLEKLKRPKLAQPIIEILSDPEIEAIFSTINPNCDLGARLQTIVYLLYDTGMRASELCSIKLDNVHMDNSQIKLVGKGNKERFVPFSPATKKALIRYINTWRPEPAREEYTNLVLTEDGYPLTYGALLQIIKRLGKRVGVPRLHPHLFRHSFAVRYLMNGSDLMRLKLILGHTTIQVTEQYLHLTSTHVSAEHSKFSPLDRLQLSRKRVYRGNNKIKSD